MALEIEQPQTFAEMVLALLEDRFPWLASEEQEAVSGADTVQTLSDLHESLVERRIHAHHAAHNRS